MARRYSILVVDDDLDSLTLLTEILTAEGYRVRSANSGQLALSSVQAWLPQLILLDIRMPGIDGFEVCRRLKASRQSRHVPLMFISAANEMEERVAGFALGAVDYITKPFRREELLARVRTHLELGRLRARLEQQVLDRTIELRASIDLLRESEERFRTMANTAPVMIRVSTPDKLCTFFNKGWLTFTGRSMEQEQGNGWAAGVHTEDLDRYIGAYSSSFDLRQDFQLEYRLLRADGEYRWVLDHSVPRFAPAGVFLGYIGTTVDITDLKRSQEETLARQKLESLRALTRGIAHDFNNLMGGVLAQAELAEAQLEEGVSPGQEIQQIKAVAIRAAEIVRQLMIYSGQETAHLEIVDLSGLVEEMLQLLKVSISKHATLRSDLGRHLPAVSGNATLIRQIVMNLIVNALQALGGEGGSIHVQTSFANQCPDTAPHGTRNTEDRFVRLRISDTGCGMTEVQKTRMFDPFFTTKPGGHGLGLAVVQGIVHSYGGTIKVVSAPGRGTAIEILLPCAGTRALKRSSRDMHHTAEERSARSGESAAEITRNQFDAGVSNSPQ